MTQQHFDTKISSVFAVAYLRVSTDEQEYGLDAQRKEIEAWSAHNGIRIDEWFEDHISGSTSPEERPGLTACLRHIHEKEVHFLVVQRRDRIARDMLVISTIEAVISKLDCRVLTAYESPDEPDTPEKALLRGIIDQFAVYERMLLRARTKAGLERAKAAGVKLGGKKPWNNPKLFEWMKDCHKKGLTFADMKDRLNREGFRTRSGKEWTSELVRKTYQRYCDVD